MADTPDDTDNPNTDVLPANPGTDENAYVDTSKPQAQQAAQSLSPQGGFTEDEARGPDGDYGAKQRANTEGGRSNGAEAAGAFTEDEAKGKNGDYKPEPEEQTSPYGAFLRGAARSIIPTAVGGAAAVAAGAAAAPVTGGLGSVPFAAAGAIEGSALAEAGQNKLADALGLTDPKSLLGGEWGGFNPFNKKLQEEDAAQHGTAEFAGELAPMALTGKPNLGKIGAAAQVATRGVGAAAGAGIETGRELYNGEPLDPLRIGAAGAVQAAFPGIRGTKGIEAAVGPDTRIPDRINKVMQPQAPAPGGAAASTPQTITQDNNPSVPTSLGNQPKTQSKSSTPQVGDTIAGRPGKTEDAVSVSDKVAQIKARAAEIVTRGATTDQTKREITEVGDPGAPMQRRIAEKLDGPRRQGLKPTASPQAATDGTQKAPTTGAVAPDVAAALPKGKGKAASPPAALPPPQQQAPSQPQDLPAANSNTRNIRQVGGMPTVPFRQASGQVGQVGNPTPLPRAPFREAANDVNAPQRPPLNPAVNRPFGNRQPGGPPAPPLKGDLGFNQQQENMPAVVRQALQRADIAKANAAQFPPGETALGAAMQKAQTAKRGQEFEQAVEQRGEQAKSTLPAQETVNPDVVTEAVPVNKEVSTPEERAVTDFNGGKAPEPGDESDLRNMPWVKNRGPNEPTGEAAGTANRDMPATADEAWNARLSRYSPSAREEMAKGGFEAQAAEKTAKDTKRIGKLKASQATRDALTQSRAEAAVAQREGYRWDATKARYVPDPVARAAALKSGRAVDTSMFPTKPNLLKDFWNDEAGSLNVDKINEDFRANAAKLKAWIGNGMNVLRPIVKYNAAIRNFSKSTFGQPDTLRSFYASAILAHNAANASRLQAVMHNELVSLMDAGDWAWRQNVTTKENKAFRDVFQVAGKQDKTDDADWIVKHLTDRGVDADRAQMMAERAPIFKALQDLAFAREKDLGSPAEQVKGYLQGIYENSPKFNSWIDNKIQALGPNGFMKDKVFEFIADAEKEGFKSRYDNVPDMVANRLNQSAHMQSLMETMDHLRDIRAAYKEDDPTLPQDFKNWTRFADPTGVRWRVAPDVAPIFENAIVKKGMWGDQGKLGTAYRGAMAVKASWIPIKFMASAYHMMHITYANYAAHLARGVDAMVHDKDAMGLIKAQGQFLNDIFALPLHKIPFGVGTALDKVAGGRFAKYGQIQEEWKTPLDQLSPEARERVTMMKWMGISPFRNEQEYTGNTKDALQRAWTNMASEGWKLPFLGSKRLLEKIQQPFFEYTIPMLKASSAMRDAAAVLNRNKELLDNPANLRVALQAIGKQNDNRFGEMFYNSLHWDPMLKDAMQGVSVSLGWNLGIPMRETGGAFRDVLAGRQFGTGNEAQRVIYNSTNKATYVAAYVATSMLSNGALSYMLSGIVPNVWDMFFPRNGHTNPDGTPGRLQTMSNIRDIPAAMAHSQEYNSVTWGIMRTLYDKTILAPLVELWNNRDFFGNQMYDTNAPAWKALLEAIDSTLGNQISPTVATGIQRSRDLGGTARDTALAELGYQPAPQYANKSAMQNRIEYLYRSSQPARPYARSGSGLVQGAYNALTGQPQSNAAAVLDARKEMNKAIINKDSAGIAAAAAKMRNLGVSRSATKGAQNPAEKYNFMFSRLSPEDQENLVGKMTPEEYQEYVGRLPKGKIKQRLTTYYQGLQQ